uniref:zincin-like metallopeptidase domain-containing protein n=1 Tax=Cupriavidus gilardii TaxID=82541 RepID=UPI00247ADB81|nr:zincin-like metallopeptidase domain-containing protein [Cupriavidus gilardii]WDE72649.1 IncP-type DNA transfer primase TraC [Cupriavidus gilardii]
MAANDVREYRQALTERLIEQLKAGTAPWQKPWDPRDGSGQLPYNAVTGRPYRGMNSLWLSAIGMASGFDDPRWATFKQAQAQGWQVRKGSKGVRIEYYVFTEQRGLVDESGAPVLGEDGKQKKITVELERPIRTTAVVFHVSQMDGVPELKRAPRLYEWDPIERAEQILAASGARIIHDQNDRAFYTSVRDEIHMPKRDQFRSDAAYYSTALHELGHWTGHESRLNRKLGNSFGSPDYAKEELRAELASYFLADQLGIPHDPGQHAAYVGSWIKALEDDHNEIFRAAADAQKITEYVLGMDRDKSVEKEVGRELETAKQPSAPARERREPQPGDTIISTPFKERAEASQLGAQWAPAAKTWYVPAGVDLQPFQRWAPITPFEQWEANGRQHPVVRETGKPAPAPAHNAEAPERGKPVRERREPQPGDTIINVPYRERADAGKLGAQWAPDAKTWYVPAGIEVRAFSKWAPLTPFAQWMANGRQHAMTTPEQNPEQRAERTVERPYRLHDAYLEAPRLHFSTLAEAATAFGYSNHAEAVLYGPGDQRLAWTELENGGANATPKYAMPELQTLVEAAERERFAGKPAPDFSAARMPELSPPVKTRPVQRAPEPEPTASGVVKGSTPPARKPRQPAREPDVALGDIILAVPYAERFEAAKLGAEFGKEAKTWYIPAGVDPAPLQKWLPGRDIAVVPARDPHKAFGDELRAFGLVIDGDPIMDGKLHRVPLVDGKPKGRDGAYVGHLDGRPAGYMQNFVTGEKRTWKLDGPELTAAQKAEIAAQAAIAKQRRAAELDAQHEASAKRAQERWERAEALPRGATTPYLDRKKVQALGVRREGENLLVPARDINGKLWSVQTIFPEKRELEPGTEPLDKVFTKGAKKEGNFHLIGHVRDGEPLLVMEGYATGASAHMATGYAVAVAFDSGNLEHVVGALKEKHPTIPIFIGADDDRFPKPGREFRNAGLQKAIEAANAHDVGVIVPMFSTDGRLTDFNDLHVTEGLGEVKAQIQRGISVSMDQSRRQAEQIIAQQLGEHAPVRQPGAHTRHTGEVLGVTGYHVAQHTGRDGTVHRTQDLDVRPRAGTVATVQYAGGRGKVTEKSQEQLKEKSLGR